MTPAEIDLLVHRYLAADGGYLFGFSYNDHDSFYTQYCDMPGVDVASGRARYGSTKRVFRAILAEAAPAEQARIIRGVLTKFPPEEFATDDAPKRADAARRLLEVAARLDGLVVSGGERLITTETVQRALADAEGLLTTSGAVSAVDRVHTALHGHLRYLSAEARIVVEQADAPPGNYLTALINEHPKLQVPGPRRDEIKRILRTSNAIIAAVNTIRNNASLAHPNEELLDEHEAMLVINLTRTLLQYLDRKLSTDS